MVDIVLLEDLANGVFLRVYVVALQQLPLPQANFAGFVPCLVSWVGKGNEVNPCHSDTHPSFFPRSGFWQLALFSRGLATGQAFRNPL